MKKFFCNTCDCRTDSHIETRDCSLPVKGEQTLFSADIRICDNCGNECYDPDLEARMFETAYDIFREKHGIIYPSEIRELRAKYKVSQKNLALLLGFGEVTITRYETGNLPAESHNTLLKLIRNPENYLEILDSRPDAIDRKAFTKTRNAVQSLVEIHPVCSREEIVEHDPEYSGNRNFEMNRFREMVVLIALLCGEIYRTKLNKLLFYADFLAYRLQNKSISGSRYVHLQYGPVPDNYSALLDQMQGSDIDFVFDEDYRQEKIKAAREADTGIFSDLELTILRVVAKEFRYTSGKEISEISHDEPAYNNTKDRQEISYKYALELKYKFDI